MDEDMRSMGIKGCVAQDRCAWRNAIRGPTVPARMPYISRLLCDVGGHGR